MDGKLSVNDQKQLEDWIELGPRRFALLYSITRDGCSSFAFHQRCDYQGPTVTVLYNEQGSVYGGYTSASWSGINASTRDDRAFLFQLRYSGDHAVRKFSTKNASYSIYCSSTNGPMFGGNTGYDLDCFSGTIKPSGEYFKLNGRSTFGSNYSMLGVSSWNDINNGNLQVTGLEVYSVGVQPSRTTSVSVGTDDKEPSPWGQQQEFNEELKQELLQEIASLKPCPELELKDYRVLLVGPVGAGKSSFVNTVYSAFKGRIVQRAACGEQGHSFTKCYQTFPVPTKKNGSLHIRLCDTRGLEPDLGINIKEFDYLIKSYVSYLYSCIAFIFYSQLNFSFMRSLPSLLFSKKPSLADKVHCVVFVIDASTLDTLTSAVVNKMKEFVELAARDNIKQAMLITKVDVIDYYVKESPLHALNSKKVEDAVSKASKMFGFPRYSILPVKNYEEEAEVREEVDILALLALRKLLHFAEDYMDGILNDRGIFRNISSSLSAINWHWRLKLHQDLPDLEKHSDSD
ncbi:interferon-induced protein 44-like [Mya arenaria]|uniref:interferon-induced protein 44-like n=1 Tax=Mya arenaria TaxID=6604 RepID=UPI0022E0BD37|nr:interferon-induced protein 44-like [Mya arenaria]